MAAVTGPVVLPREPAGWWHDYVCPVHGVELEHGDLLAGRFPGGHCSYGCRVDTPQVRAAWTVLAHQACARRIRRLALSGRCAEAAGLLREYALVYASAPRGRPAGWMVPGRLFHQALTETIWAVTIGEAALAVALAGPDQELAGVLPLLDDLTALAGTARQSMVERGEFRSNYTAWFNAAGAVCSGAAAAIRGGAPDGDWIGGPFGIGAHVLASSTSDGWQWEASTYYHGFVLRAALLALRRADPAAVDPAVMARLRAMAQVLADLTTPGGLVPALHDGPYRRDGLDEEWAELACLAPAVVRAEQACVVQPGGGYAILRTAGLQAVLAFGAYGGSHGHLDALALSLYGDRDPFQPDPGQVPYGHQAWRDYYRSTAAHPTFSVDGGEQAPCTGRLVSSTASSVLAAADDAYPGVAARRHVSITADGRLCDELTVTCDRPRRIRLQLRPDVPLTASVDGPVVRTRWAGGTTLHGEHSAGVNLAVSLRPGPGPADDPQRSRQHLDLTSEPTREVTFMSFYRIDRPAS